MKLYVIMCSLSLLAGAALGHLNGKYSAASNFVDDCVASSMVTFQDAENDSKRRFHCFELEAPTSKPASDTKPGKPQKYI